jgi:hypothetical protein
MIFDMTYDGQNITWLGRGAFKATSGLPGSQLPKNSCVPDSSPIPEGFYKVFISDHGTAKDDGTGYCTLKPSWGDSGDTQRCGSRRMRTVLGTLGKKQS